MEDPVDIFLILTDIARTVQTAIDEPQIEIERHGRIRIVIAAMLRDHFSIYKIADRSTRHLCYERMPACETARVGIAGVIRGQMVFRKV